MNVVKQPFHKPTTKEPVPILNNNYFNDLNCLLKKQGIGQPTLILDLDILNQNLKQLLTGLNPHCGWRLAVKSLPCPKLLKHIQQQTNKFTTNTILHNPNLMVFHAGFIPQLLKDFPQNLLLLGKPMPIQAVTHIFKTLNRKSTDKHQMDRLQKNIIWLIDSETRLEQYLQLAQLNHLKFKVAIEIDIGLHRGGIESISEIKHLLQQIKQHHQYFIFSGLMGYDAHLSKLSKSPKSLQIFYFNRTIKQYASFKSICQKYFPNQNLIFNGAGSLTYHLYRPLLDSSPINDITIGSALVKPQAFCTPYLSNFKPALFIATPVLKTIFPAKIPFIELANTLLGHFKSIKKNNIVIYGGDWAGKVIFPKGLKTHPLFGNSANQQILLSSSETESCQVDDYIFFHPLQSESLIQQFSDVTIIKNQKLINFWPTFVQ